MYVPYKKILCMQAFQLSKSLMVLKLLLYFSAALQMLSFQHHWESVARRHTVLWLQYRLLSFKPTLGRRPNKSSRETGHPHCCVGCLLGALPEMRSLVKPETTG